MMIEKKGPMTPEQVESYRKAVAPLLESLAAARAARQGVLQSLRNRGPAPELCGAAGREER
jgi:hypothetical protein